MRIAGGKPQRWGRERIKGRHSLPRMCMKACGKNSHKGYKLQWARGIWRGKWESRVAGLRVLLDKLKTSWAASWLGHMTRLPRKDRRKCRAVPAGSCPEGLSLPQGPLLLLSPLSPCDAKGFSPFLSRWESVREVLRALSRKAGNHRLVIVVTIISLP